MPIDTVFALEEENLVSKKYFRPSKRQKLLAYEKILNAELLEKVTAVSQGELDVKTALKENISTQDKRYMLEASSELLEYLYIENKINKDAYKQRFHTVLHERSKLGRGESITIDEPDNPDRSHRANLITLQTALQEDNTAYMLGFRPAYHTIFDSDRGLLRGTQIEFLSFLLHYSNNEKLNIEEMTILSLASIAQRSTFFKPFSWRTSFKFDRNYLRDDLLFKASVGAGHSWGNVWSYFYVLTDLLFYVESSSSMGISASLGAVVYETERFKTNIEWTQRLYVDGTTQSMVNISELWSFDENRAFKLQYDYVQYLLGQKRTVKLVFDYFF
jgi:hypothetical protein